MKARRKVNGQYEDFDKVRNCLRCDKEFDSYGGARLCDRCNAINSKEYVMHVCQIPKTVQVPTAE